MSQSNNTQEFDNILFQVNGDESNRNESVASPSKIRAFSKTKPLIFDDGSSAVNDIMSLEDFLDLVPANSYFH